MSTEGTTRTKEVVVAAAVVVVGAIQMAVVVEVVAEVLVATKMAATSIMISLETFIRGTTIIIEEGVAEVEGTLITTKVRQVKVVMPLLMLEWSHDDTHCVSIECQVPSFIGGW